MIKFISFKQLFLLAVVVGLWCGDGLKMTAQILPIWGPADLAINGGGWFVVRDPVSGEMFVTR